MKFTLIVFWSLLIVSCSEQKQLETSFFVAGHTYGNPRDKSAEKGLYKPFKDKLDFINQQEKMQFGVLLGDVVRNSKAWPEAKKDIAKLRMPIYVARGNHDGALKKFEEYFGKTYRKFIEQDSLFIILDPNLDRWNISNGQLVFLKNALESKPDNIRNIFIFFHQLLWWNKEKYSKPMPNSFANRAESTNFWTTIEPLLRSQSVPVFLFAGDVGAFSKERRKSKRIIEYYYHSYDNITFIASGMGGGVRDNFVIANVFDDGSVEFRLIHLNGNNINSLGELEAYKDE